MLYRMQWESATVGLPWQYDFDMPSDRMAIEYAQRHTGQMDSRTFMAMLLWRMKDDGDGELIARFALNEPTVRNTVRYTTD